MLSKGNIGLKNLVKINLVWGNTYLTHINFENSKYYINCVLKEIKPKEITLNPKSKQIVLDKNSLSRLILNDIVVEELNGILIWYKVIESNRVHKKLKNKYCYSQTNLVMPPNLNNCFVLDNDTLIILKKDEFRSKLITNAPYFYYEISYNYLESKSDPSQFASYFIPYIGTIGKSNFELMDKKYWYMAKTINNKPATQFLRQNRNFIKKVCKW
jgi:hypothetical protein